MILENTAYPTIIKTMYDEREKVRYFAQKMATKMPKIPAGMGGAYITYTNPQSKNTYMCWFGKMVTPGRFLDTTGKHSVNGSFLIVNTSSGERMVMQLAYKYHEGKKYDALIIYTAHFFKRYRERFDYPDDMPSNDLICNFMNRNYEMRPLDYSKVSRKGDPNGSAFQCNDGIILGTTEMKEENGYKFFVARHNTFISEAEFKSNQAEEWMTDADYANEFIDFVKTHLREDPFWSQYMR